MVEIWSYLPEYQNESGKYGIFGLYGFLGIYGIHGLYGKCGQNPKYHAGIYGVSCGYLRGIMREDRVLVVGCWLEELRLVIGR